jgi:DNA repair ATPase RecN
MTMMIRTVAVAVCATLLGASVAAAQLPADAPARGRTANANAAGLSPVEVLNMLDAYALVQAEHALELRDQQYGNFVTRLKRLQETRRRNQQARNKLVQELRRMTQAQAKPADDGVIVERLKALKDHDQRAAAELGRAYDALDEVLDVRQQARFRAFEDNLERRKIDLLMRARRGAAGRQGQ